MMNDSARANRLQNELMHFSGTDTWYRHSNILRGFYYTDGVKHMADEAGAYWLIDIALSIQLNPKIRGEEFQVFQLKVDTENGTGKVTVDDGNGNILYKQKIPFTDFPLEEIKLYIVKGGVPGHDHEKMGLAQVLMLTGEY